MLIQMIDISNFNNTLMILGLEAKTTLLNIWVSLIIFLTSSMEICMLVNSEIYGMPMIFKKDFD